MDQLYRRYGPLVFRRARTLLGNDHAARDVVQEVFMRAIRTSSTFRAESSPSTWLYRITTNYCFNVIRDASRRDRMERRLNGEHEAGPVTSPHAVDQPELRVLLGRVLQRLPEHLCEIAVYYYVDRMSQDEIAAVTGTSRKTVGNRLKDFHARADVLIGGTREISA